MKKIEIADKSLRIINSMINNFAIIILVLLMLISAYAIIDKRQIYEDAKISQDVEALKPKDNDVTFSLNELQKINSEINGWIRIYDTNMDYPTVQSSDNTKYLTSNYKAENTGSGSIFLDYRNNVNFEDDYSILYGHNIQSGLMFSDIIKYKDKTYFNNHSIGRLYTDNGQYKIEVFSYAHIDSSKDDVYNLTQYRKGQNEYLNEFYKRNSIVYKDINIKSTDKLILLSTCDNAGTFNRAVLLARITKETEELQDITTKESKLKEGSEPEEEVTEKALEAPAPKNVEARRISLFSISFYNLALILCIIVVLGIFSVVLKRKLENKKLALATQQVQQVDTEPMKVQQTAQQVQVANQTQNAVQQTVSTQQVQQTVSTQQQVQQSTQQQSQQQVPRQRIEPQIFQIFETEDFLTNVQLEIPKVEENVDDSEIL